jgi:hypothetical protein
MSDWRLVGDNYELVVGDLVAQVWFNDDEDWRWWVGDAQGNGKAAGVEPTYERARVAAMKAVTS